ncbi:MAG: hypothetical protein ABI662_04350 [Dermatophilaceae bacterium]
MTSTVGMPELVPVLSRGKHRNAKRGACFMEMASFLAGERWSDHPSCTHPLLAGLARLVNDTVSDARRPQLIPLIPSVIGLTSDDLHFDTAIALRAALTALPIASASRQHVLATAVVACERVISGLDGRDRDAISARSRAALDKVPDAASWARSFSGGLPVSARTFRIRTAPHILNVAVEGISLACAPDVEQRLVDLLAATIAECQGMVAREPATKDSTVRALA